MENSQDKTHQATPKKLQDARKKGEIVRSQELNTLIIYATMTLAFLAFGERLLLEPLASFRSFWSMTLPLDSLSSREEGIIHLRSALQGSLFYVAVLILLLPGAVLFLAAAQKAIIFTPSNLNPRLNRISPIQGLKSKLGPTGIFDFFKNLLKASIFVALIVAIISPGFDEFPHFSRINYFQSLDHKFAEVLEIFLYVTAITLGIAVLDYTWQYHKFQKKNMMSYQEVKDEVKESEGDPHFKAIQRQRGIEITSSQVAKAVQDADVVIVNPTHFAVALNWEPPKSPAPVIAAVGLDHRALHIRSLAREYDVPVYVDIPTARALARNFKVGDTITPEHYAAVAAAIRFSRDIAAR